MSDYLMLDPKLTAQAFCGAEAKEIAEFFNEFGRFFEIVCRKSWAGESWMHSKIADALDGQGARIIKELHEAFEARIEAERTAKEVTPKHLQPQETTGST